MRLNVKPDEIGSQQAIHQLTLPGTNAKGFRVGPRDVPEDGYAGIRSLLFDQPRQQCEVVVLDQNHGLGGIFNLLKHSIGEFLVDLPIVLPILCPKNRACVGNVAERPEALVGKTVVVTFLLFFVEPYTAQGVAGIVGRNAQAIVRVHGFHVGVSVAVGDPRPIASIEYGFESGHQATGGNNNVNRFSVPLMHVWFAIGNDNEPAAIEPVSNLHGKPVRRPHGFSCRSQASFTLRGAAGLVEARGHGRDFARQRPEQIEVRHFLA